MPPSSLDRFNFNITIGIGRNLDAKGISLEEAKILLVNDILEARKDIHDNLPWASALPDDVQAVLVNMTFNMGVGGLLAFKKFLAALQSRRYEDAHHEMLQSKWATQVGVRAKELAAIVRGID